MRKSLHENRPASREIDWRNLAVLLAVNEAGSVRSAAERLNTGPALVSRALKDLEQQLGVELVMFAKGGRRPASLTEAGQRVVERAEGIALLMEGIHRDVSMRDYETEGEVSIVCPDGLGTYFLAPAIAAFQREFPGICIDLRTRSDPAREAHITIQLVEEKARMTDVAIPLGWQHYAHFASKDYVETYGAMIEPVEAVQHRMLQFVDHKEQKQRWERKMVELQALIDPALRTDCGTAILQATANGAGVAALPTYVVCLDSRLVMVGKDERAHARFWLICDHERSQLPRFKETIAWLKNIFEPRANPWFRQEFIPPENFEAALQVANRRSLR